MAGTYCFTAYELGQIKAHLYHDVAPAEIARIVFKPDGINHYSVQAVHDAIARMESDKDWRGERKVGSGAARQTSAKQDRLIVKEVFRKRGRNKVTVAMLKKKFPFLRKFGDTLVEQRLHEAGLKWMRRRRKTLVPTMHLRARVNFCQMVKRKHQETLNRWCYSDGTVFFLDKDEAANESTQRRALGGYVWRRADHSDALYADCVGPSCYSKGQGYPVKVWGLLAEGILHIDILPEGESMDRFLYTELIEDKFPEWMGSCCYLVQDYEGLNSIGLELVKEYPKVSQDFNPIENAWKLLRDRLDETLPSGLERRGDFVARLMQAVSWVNRYKKTELAYLSTNLKERAQDCLSAVPPGSRTKW